MFSYSWPHCELRDATRLLQLAIGHQFTVECKSAASSVVFGDGLMAMIVLMSKQRQNIVG